MEKIIFAAGCFWGIQYKFKKIQGVTQATAGYTGGHTLDPNYKEVCADQTGHAEAVLVEFNPEEVSLNTLLEHFWSMHDPTQKDRQGVDIGSQYRSAIFYFSDDQYQTCKDSLDKENQKLSGKIQTQLIKASNFYPAEEYHQDYIEKNGASCSL